MSEVRVRLPLGACRGPAATEQESRESREEKEQEVCSGQCASPAVYSLHFYSVWESLGIRLPWAQEIVSSNLTTLTALRWSSCWYQSRLKSGLAATTLIALWPSGQAAPC